jgi:hypothetical protein
MALSWWMLYDANRCAERLSISTPYGHHLSITEVLDMKKGLRLWFYLEAILGIIAAVLFVVTLINQQWIEMVFNVDPALRMETGIGGRCLKPTALRLMMSR